MERISVLVFDRTDQDQCIELNQGPIDCRVGGSPIKLG